MISIASVIFLRCAMSHLLRVPRRVREVLPTSPNGAVDLDWRHHPLLGETMGNDGRDVAAKEVQHAVMNSLMPDPQLVNPVTKQVRLRSPQFVATCSQALQPRFTLRDHLD